MVAAGEAAAAMAEAALAAAALAAAALAEVAAATAAECTISAAYSSGAHYSGASAGNFIHAGNANFSHTGNANYLHSGNQNWSGHGNNWNNWGHNNWDHYFNHGGYGYGGYGGYGGWGWGWGWGWPWGIGLSWGWPYGGYYDDYFCPYGPYYSSAYPASVYAYNYADEGPYVTTPDEGQYAVASPPLPNAAEQLPPPAEQTRFRCPSVLQRGPRSVSARQLSRCAALGRSCGRRSAAESQGTRVEVAGRVRGGRLSRRGDRSPCRLGPRRRSTWAELYSYYNDNDKYTEQLRKLEKTVATVPDSAPGQFLLGYQYLMTGAKAEAKEHFAKAAKLTPKDKLVTHILKQLDAGSAVTPPELPKPPAAGGDKPQLPPPPQAKGPVAVITG